MWFDFYLLLSLGGPSAAVSIQLRLYFTEIDIQSVCQDSLYVAFIKQNSYSY